jgi:hypothetical protein
MPRRYCRGIAWIDIDAVNKGESSGFWFRLFVYFEVSIT